MTAPRCASAAAMEVLEWSRPLNLPGMEILAAENSGRRWRVFHETYTVCTALDDSGGCSEWTYRRRPHETRAGTLMLMEPGELHVVRRVTGLGTYRVIFIPPSAMIDAAAEMAVPGVPHFAAAVAAHPYLYRRFAALHRALESGATRLEQQSRLADCLLSLLTYCAERSPANAPAPPAAAVERVRDHIHDAYDQNLGLDDLAAAAGISRFQLCRWFARQFGLAPHAYLVAVRVAKARLLLAQGVPPATVAFRTGFCDQSHLGRRFQGLVGVSPKRYAEMTGMSGRQQSSAAHLDVGLHRAAARTSYTTAVAQL